MPPSLSLSLSLWERARVRAVPQNTEDPIRGALTPTLSQKERE